MTDIVIPYSDIERHKGFELRYALRSIEKHLTGYRNVYIVGKKRDWLTGVTWIDADDIPERKQFSIFNKMLTAAKVPEISDPFLRWHDDTFLLKPLDVKDIKFWKEHTLKYIANHVNGLYSRTVSHTLKYCESKGWPTDHYDIHVPILYEKEKIIDLAKEDWTRDKIVKSLYCNKYMVQGEEMKDLVIRKPMKREQIREAIEGRLFFAINEAGTNEAVKAVLQELYPEPSRWEIFAFTGIEFNTPNLIESFEKLK